MKTKLMALMLMAGGAMFAETHVAIGVQFGRPGPVAVRAYRPPCPGPGYVWVDGYYDPYGVWLDGYWDMPPYVGAYWVAPRFYSGRYTAGYWGGPRGAYHVAPRYAPRVYERGYERGYDRGYHDRGGRPPEHDRGGRPPEHGRGGEYRNGYRR